MPEKATSPVTVGLALEYSLGHTTHSQNLKRVLEDRKDIAPICVDLHFHDHSSPWSRLPGIRSNWTLRASLHALLGLRAQRKRLQALLFHTQVTSLFSVGLMQRVPAVISLDATPIQYDALGAHYGHAVSANGSLESFKKRLNIRAFRAARRLVTWSQWTKDSLVRDYGVPAEKIVVIPPGIDTQRWHFPRSAAQPNSTLHLLFVGGDFLRKGGDVLLKAFQALPNGLNVELHLVSTAEQIPEGLPNIHVYRDLKPNSPQLLQLFQQADLFVFPTRADCLPLAIMEALAAGLPIITTSVGALPEAVQHDETGWIVPPDDAQALADAITLLARDAALRARLSARAREVALANFDAETNYRRLIDTVKSVAC